MIGNPYQLFFFTILWAGNWVYKEPWRFLNEDDIVHNLHFRIIYWWWSCFCKCSEKKFWVYSKLCLFTVHNWMNQLLPVVTEFLILFGMSFSIEIVSSKQTLIWICLMIIFTVQILEWIRTQFVLFGIKSWRVSLGVSFTAPHKVIVVFRLMRAIVFHALWTLNPAWKSNMTLLLVVLVLGDLWVHVCSSNSSNEASNIEVPVD